MDSGSRVMIWLASDWISDLMVFRHRHKTTDRMLGPQGYRIEEERRRVGLASTMGPHANERERASELVFASRIERASSGLSLSVFCCRRTSRQRMRSCCDLVVGAARLRRRRGRTARPGRRRAPHPARAQLVSLTRVPARG